MEHDEEGEGEGGGDGEGDGEGGGDGEDEGESAPSVLPSARFKEGYSVVGVRRSGAPRVLACRVFMYWSSGKGSFCWWSMGSSRYARYF